MELKIAAMVLKELGHTTRLDIYKTLVKAGRQGLPVGGTAATSRHSGLDPESSSFIADIRLTGSPGKAGENTVLPRLL